MAARAQDQPPGQMQVISFTNVAGTVGDELGADESPRMRPEDDDPDAIDLSPLDDGSDHVDDGWSPWSALMQWLQSKPWLCESE